MLTFIRYIEVYFMFVFLGCVRYNEDFLREIEVRYIEVLFNTFYCNFG